MYTAISTYIIGLIAFISSFHFDETYTISGFVYASETRKPIAYGSIKVSSEVVKVDSKGSFTIHGLRKGKHKLVFTAFGYNEVDTVITFLSGNIKNFRWPINSECMRYSRESGLKDIKVKKARILLQGGIAPVVNAADKSFSTKYNIEFYDLGCVTYDRKECLAAYNGVIFEYLDNTFGKNWRKEIRKDAFALQ